MRGAPQSRFSMLIFLISARRPESIRGPPSPSTRLPTPIAAKARPMPTHQRFGMDDRKNVKNQTEIIGTGAPEPAVAAGEPSPTWHPTPQNDQLMSEYRVLCFKPTSRLEWRGEYSQEEAEQRKHSALTLGDFFG